MSETAKRDDGGDARAVAPEVSGEANAGAEVSGEANAEAEVSGEANAEQAVVARPEGATEPTAEEIGGTVKKPGRLQQLVVEYGAIALVVHFTLFGLTVVGFAIAISAGFSTEGAGEETGVWLAAYIASQVTKPVRLVLVVVLTPGVAAVWNRLRGRKKPPSQPKD